MQIFWAPLADSASVYDRGFFSFLKKSVKFRVIARCYDQRVNGPSVAIEFNRPVLDDTKVDLYKIFFIFIYFITEMDASPATLARAPRAGEKKGQRCVIFDLG